MPHQYEIDQAIEQNYWLTEALRWASDEIARLKRENASYALWMNRSIERIKEMQQ